MEKRSELGQYTLAATLYTNKPYSLEFKNRIEDWLIKNKRIKSWLVKESVQEYLINHKNENDTDI